MPEMKKKGSNTIWMCVYEVLDKELIPDICLILHNNQIRDDHFKPRWNLLKLEQLDYGKTTAVTRSQLASRLYCPCWKLLKIWGSC